MSTLGTKLFCENILNIKFNSASLSNLLFILSFKHQKIAGHIFGWNLIGATLGVFAEYASIVTGYTALIWVVAGCYSLVGICLLLSKKQRSQDKLKFPRENIPDKNLA